MKLDLERSPYELFYVLMDSAPGKVYQLTDGKKSVRIRVEGPPVFAEIGVTAGNASTGSDYDEATHTGGGD